MAAFNPKMNSSLSNPGGGQASCRMCSFVALLLVLALQECSGFAPQVQTPRDKPTAATAFHGTMDLLALFATDATAESSTAATVASSYAQKFLAESEASGRVLTKRDQKWWVRFEELEEYKRERGDCNVPQKFDANPQLGIWVHTQRQNYNKNNLSSERIETLESIGFKWVGPRGGGGGGGGGSKPDDPTWWERHAELKEYKQIHGDCNVPINYQANPQLAKWVMNQRAYYHRFIDENWKRSPGISEERIGALNEIGFEWRLRERPEWDDRYDELVIYKEEHGDTLVPTDQRRGGDNKYRDLAMWVNTQRREYRLLQEGNHSQITDERIEKLEAIGFVWDAREAAWEEMFAELVSYKEKHGDTLVRHDSQLGVWVCTQRNQYRLLEEGKHSLLTDIRIRKLSKIGFVWDLREAAWEEKFVELVEFKATHGHTDVPSSWEDQELFWWVSLQRREHRKLKEEKPTQITEERIERLDGIGFEWKSKRTYQWKIRLDELRDFYDENGVVPIPRAKHPNLYNWARNQKKEYDMFVKGEKTNMDEDRIKDLESIGFFEVYKAQ